MVGEEFSGEFSRTGRPMILIEDNDDDTTRVKQLKIDGQLDCLVRGLLVQQNKKHKKVGKGTW